MILQVTIRIKDADGDLSSVSYHISPNTANTLSSIQSLYVDPVADALSAIITGSIIGASVTIETDVSIINGDLTSDIEEKLLLVLSTCDNVGVTRLTIPTIDENVFVNSGAGKQLDLTNSDVIALLSFLTGGEFDSVDSHGYSICGVVSAIQKFR